MATVLTRITPLPPPKARSWRLIERNFLVYRHDWLVFVSGFFEPLFYLLSIGVGVSALVGDFPAPNGELISYTEFVAPAMLATAAMNGAIFDATYNVFFKLKYVRTYDALLATPMGPREVAWGEVTWALLRGAIYSLAFFVVMVALGLVGSWWGLLVPLAAVLIAFAFAGAGMAVTTWMRSWQDFEFIGLVTLPLFLFSATFYPLSSYPDPIQTVVQVTPLYQGVALCRALTTGAVEPELLLHAGYLAVMGAVGMSIASRRLGLLLLK